MASLKKQQTVDKIIKFFESYPNLTLLKFERTKHSTLEELRRSLKKSQAKLKVVKNSIFAKALEKAAAKNPKIKDFSAKIKTLLSANTAIMGLSNDWSMGLNAFSKFSDKEKSLSFKAGILDGKIYLAEQMLAISKLPSKGELIAKIIGSLNAPISKTVYSIKFNTNKLVYVLKAKAAKSNLLMFKNLKLIRGVI